MGDENHIRTLGDYSKPSHEGYRNTIQLPGTHDTQYCMGDPEQAFVEYVSSRTDEAEGEMTNKIDTVLKAITDQIAGTLPSDTVKNPKLGTHPVSSVRSYPTMDPQCSSYPSTSINAIKAHFNEATISQTSLQQPVVEIEPQQLEEPKPNLEDEFQDLHLNLPILEAKKQSDQASRQISKQTSRSANAPYDLVFTAMGPPLGTTQTTATITTPPQMVPGTNTTEPPPPPLRNKGPELGADNLTLEGVATELAPSDFVSQNYETLVALMQEETKKRSSQSLQA
ncbi:hypothetical protein Tco_1419806 [Tanacetum coccineum]